MDLRTRVRFSTTTNGAKLRRVRITVITGGSYPLNGSSTLSLGNGPVKLNKFEVDKFGALELQFSITESEKITVRLPVDSLSVKKEIKAGSDWFVQITTD